MTNNVETTTLINGNGRGRNDAQRNEKERLQRGEGDYFTANNLLQIALIGKEIYG